ncbi:MAG: nuclear export factor [Ilumatobacteraceae bacterium]|nr:nuclear export factor [Ilumatobacteraceae bacterium]
MSRPRLRFPLAVAAAVGVALCIAGPASAHIHTDPEEVQAGTENSVGFVIEHGCEGSPTTQVELRLPEGVTAISAEDQGGFSASVDGQVVKFTGGSLPDGTEQAFTVTFTAPGEAGTIDIPLIQTCEEGSTDWIEPEVDGQPEPEHPAPQLAVAANPDATTTTSTTTAESTTTAAEAASTAVDATTTTAAPVAPVVAPEEEDDAGSTGLIIGGIVVVALLIAGGVLYARSRKGADAGPADGTTPPEGGPVDE